MGFIKVFTAAAALLLVLAGGGGKTLVEAEMVITRDPEGPVLVTEGDDAFLTLHITDIDKNVILAAHSSNPGTFAVQENATFHIQVGDRGEDASPDGVIINGNSTQDLETVATNITIRVTAKFIGISELVLQFTDAATQRQLSMDVASHVVKVKRGPNKLVEAFQFILVVWLILSYVSMGSTMNWESIWSRLKKPYGVVIGLLCQFALMPLLAFALAKMLKLDNYAALGLVIIGCCPGGWVSNIYSLLLDCDLTLSITMTMCSTVIALGAMPLNLFIYGSHFVTETITVPYGMVTLQIIMLVIPVFFGMVLYYKAPKVAAILGKCLRIIAMLMILIGFSFGIPSNLYAFYAPLPIICVSLLLPIIGSILGFLIAKATCLHNVSAVTVGLETGAQNSLLGALIAQFSFPQPEADLIARIPLLIAMFTMAYGTLVTFIYVIMNKYPGKIHVPETDKEACKECGMIKSTGKTTPDLAVEVAATIQQQQPCDTNDTPEQEGHTNVGFDKDDQIILCPSVEETAENNHMSSASVNGNANNSKESTNM